MRGDRAARAERDQRRACGGEGSRQPEAPAEPLDAEHEGEQARQHRQRPEEERDGRRGRELDRVDERELVQEDPDQGGAAERHQIAAAQLERALPPVGDGAEDRRGHAETQAAVGNRLEAVREDVLGDGEVETPEGDRRQQHQVR